MKLWNMGLALCLVAFVNGQNNEANELNLTSSSNKKLFTETTYKGTLREDNTIKIMAGIETIEPCVDYEFVVDDGNDFSADCVDNKIKITRKRSDVPRDGHLTLTLYATSTSFSAISDSTKIILDLPLTKVEKLFKKTSYEGILKEDNSVQMIDEIETMEPCKGYAFSVDESNDFSVVCDDAKIKITHEKSDVPRGGHLTLTLYATSNSGSTTDFTKIILELPLTKVEKVFIESSYEGILREDNSILMIDEIKTFEPCLGYEFKLYDIKDLSVVCNDAKIVITHERSKVPRGGHLTLTLYATSISGSTTDFTKIILELPLTNVEKLFKDTIYEGTLKEDNSIDMEDEIEINKPCTGYTFVVDDGYEFSVVCDDAKIKITHEKSDVPRDGHLTLTLYATSTSVYANADFTKIILKLPVTKVEKLFKESSYEGTLKEDNSVQMIDEIKTLELCEGYEFVVDESNDFSADCVDNKIEITHNSPDVPRDGHLTLTLNAKLTSFSAISDSTKIILELPVTKVEKLFKESSYEGSLKEDETVHMIKEIETNEQCTDYELKVDDGNDFDATCNGAKIIKITYKKDNVPRGGHLTLTLYATSPLVPETRDFTKIILELPLKEKLFKESSYEGSLKEDETVHMIKEIETNELCADYELKVDDDNDFNAICNGAKITITYKKDNVPRGGHLTLTLYATSPLVPATTDFTKIILELPFTEAVKLFKESSYEGFLKEDETVHMINDIETNEPCAGYDLKVDDGNGFNAVCDNAKIEITYIENDVPREGHMTLTLYATSPSGPATTDFTKIILELPVTKVEKLFKDTIYEGTLKLDNSIYMENEIEINKPCTGYTFVFDDGNDFSATCKDAKIKIKHEVSDVPRGGHLTLTFYATSPSSPATTDFTKIILELPLITIEKLFKETSYEGILKEDKSIQMINEIETNEPCEEYVFLVDDGNEFNAVCNAAKIEITHKKSDVPRGGHLTLTLYATSIDGSTLDFTIIILELPVGEVEKLFTEILYEGTLREDNTVEMINEIKTNKPCADYELKVDIGNDFNAVCNGVKIEITYKNNVLPRSGHKTLTLFATSLSVPPTSDFTNIILELPHPAVDKLFTETHYEGTLREDNTVEMINEIKTNEPCADYELKVDDGNDFNAVCNGVKIEITYKNNVLPRSGHKTLTLFATSLSVPPTLDFTNIILQLPLPAVDKLFTETHYEGTLREDNTVEMINEIETIEPCLGYEFVVDDDKDFCADCINNKIKIAHKSSDVPRDGHLTLTLYAKLNYFSAISDFTKIILELPVTKVEKLFMESTYEGFLKEDNTIKMMDEIETMEPCNGYEFVVDDGNDFSADCVNNIIEITHKSPDVPRDGHLTLILYAKSNSIYAIDTTVLILEVTCEDGSNDVGLIVAVALLSIILLGVLIANAVFCCQNKSLLFRAQQQFGVERNF